MEDESSREIELLGEKRISISKGQTILEASLQAGIPHFHACGGNAQCSTCRVLVVEGLDRLTPVNEKEEKLRNEMPFPPKIRLACQTGVERGPVRLQRIILEKTDVSLYIRKQMTDVNQKLGEQRDLVLFFLDIRNFTPFLEKHLPYDVIHVMRACYIIFNHLIKENGGEIIDTAGDGFYAVFGLSTTPGEAAGAALKAGKAILKELTRFNRTYLEPYFNAMLEIGIGAHCGTVIVGDVVVGSKSHLSVMGLPVNVAARIQASTKKLNNNFIASEALIMRSGEPDQGERRLIRLKGIEGVIKVQLIGESYSESRSAGEIIRL